MNVQERSEIRDLTATELDAVSGGDAAVDKALDNAKAAAAELAERINRAINSMR